MFPFNEPSALFEDGTIILNNTTENPQLHGYHVSINETEKTIEYDIIGYFNKFIVEDCCPGYLYKINCSGINRIESYVKDLYIQFDFCEGIYDWEDLSKQELILHRTCDRLMLRGDYIANDISVSGADIHNLVNYLKGFTLDCRVDNILFIKEDEGTDNIYNHVNHQVYVAGDYSTDEKDIKSAVNIRESDLFSSWETTSRKVIQQ